MNRRLDVRPLKKLRNPGRHIRSLQRWAVTADKFLPARRVLEQWSDSYLQLRVPITSKLVTPPHTTPEICRIVARALLDAAATISRSLELERPVRIAVLIEPEHLWSAGVHLFFDEDHFRSFLPPIEHKTGTYGTFTSTTTPPKIDFVADWALTLPPGFADFGGYHLFMTDAADP